MAKTDDSERRVFYFFTMEQQILNNYIFLLSEVKAVMFLTNKQAIKDRLGDAIETLEKPVAAQSVR